MKTAIKTLPLLFLALALSFGCAQRGDELGDDDLGPDASVSDTDGGDDLTVDPPAESTTWACRSGVDSAGDDYMEFRPGYLNNGAEANAYIVGDASSEGIYGYFTGAYVQESRDPDSDWYRLYLTGVEGSEFILTYARCEDKVGTNAECWAQYGSALSATAAGPFRWNSSGTNYACKGKRNVGKVATPLGGN